MNSQDKEEMRQFKRMKRIEGRRAKDKLLEIDFIRKHFGTEHAQDALKRPRSFFDERLFRHKSDTSLEEFIEEIEEFPKETKVVAILLYCGFTFKQLVKIFEVNHRTFKRILKGKKGNRSIFS